MKKNNSSSAYLIRVALTVLFVLLVALLISFYIKHNDLNLKLSQFQSYNYVDYNSNLKINIPNGVEIAQKTYEKTGSIYLSTREIKEDKEYGLVISYTKPMIEGKGGGCVDGNGNGVYSSIRISGIDADVCLEGNEINGIFLKHPNKEIEYYIYTFNDPKKPFSKEEIMQLQRVLTDSLKLF